MLTIWKFPFEINDDVEIEMPMGARILHVDMQNGSPCMWALVSSEAEKQKRRFLIFGTGHELPQAPPFEPNDIRAYHVGSFQMADGQLVWHVFARPPWMK